jgi:hypothetical protein
MRGGNNLRHFWLKVFLILLLGEVSATTNAEDEKTCEILENGEQDCSSQDESSRTMPQCSLYMAQSTIPGAGLGIFTGVDRQVDDVVGHGGDVLFPIVDVTYHLQTLGTDIVGNEDIMTNPTLNYIWFGPEMGMQQETAHPYVHVEYVSAFAPGLDAAINCNLALPNVEKRMPIYDTVGLHRSKDPGVGGYTPYHKCESYVTNPIPAGGELFKMYGDNWFEGRTDTFGLIPLSQDYPNAEKLVNEFHGFVEDNSAVWSNDVKWDLWDLIANFGMPSRLINALPKNREQFETVRKQGIRALNQPAATRSLKELDEHGRCLDYIQPGPSTVRQAGRGAFATQFLSKGTTVASSPILFFPTEDFFRMYHGRWFRKDDMPDRKRIEHYQILYNYCCK